MFKCLLGCLLLFLLTSGFSQKQKVWLDTDSGNEMDDLYAIVRLIKEQSVDLIGMSSAHFNFADILVLEKYNGYFTKGLVTVDESQRVNEEILKAMNRMDLPHPKGANRQMSQPQGLANARNSPAAEAIIQAAKNLREGEILDVITIGPLTNITSALILAPEIKPLIRLYSLGARYDPATKVWNKSEFNIRNDLNAFDGALNMDSLDFTVMPLEAAYPFKFQREETYARLNETIEIEKILEERWKVHNPQDKTRVMWDLALIEAYLKPHLAIIQPVNTPPENKQRIIKVYTKIDEARLAEDFWMVLKK